MAMVSVVMSVFNGERFLAEAIDSILHQTFSDFEFIIINDGSIDNTAALLEGYQVNDARIRVYHQQNHGLVESLNRGCALARGEYIARMDADDVAVRDRLRWQVDFMKKHSEVGVVGGAVEFVTAAGTSLRTHHQPLSDDDIKAALIRDWGGLWHPTVLMRREALLSVGGYRRIVPDAEDYDLWLRMAERFQLVNLEKVVLKYRIHSFQVTIRKCKQMALSAVAARAAAISRRSGNGDPLESAAEITPAVLAELGVSETARETALARRYLLSIGDLLNIGESVLALNAVDEALRSGEFEHADSRIMADFLLLAASVYWRQERFTQSIFRASQAIMLRPVVLGRPVKPLLGSARRKHTAGA